MCIRDRVLLERQRLCHQRGRIAQGVVALRHADLAEVLAGGAGAVSYTHLEKQLANGIPVKRLGRSDDVARAVMFFADPANSFVTGQTLFVCGGASVSSITI